MASKQLLEEYTVIIQALSEKYEAPTSQIGGILAELPDEELASLDWKDLDAIVQEGLAELGR